MLDVALFDVSVDCCLDVVSMSVPEECRFVTGVFGVGGVGCCLSGRAW